MPGTFVGKITSWWNLYGPALCIRVIFSAHLNDCETKEVVMGYCVCVVEIKPVSVLNSAA